MSYPILSAAQIQQFAEDGYVIVENLVDAEGVALLLRLFQTDQELAARTASNKNQEGEGPVTPLAYRENLGDDAYSALARSQRLAGPLEQLFGEEASHYYTLNMMKTPNTGGWQWHQDYGYHYQQFLYTDYISVMVALDPATRANGCLRVANGSNRLGRLEHETSGSQLIANRERVSIALEHLEEVSCELSPADSPLLPRQHAARLRRQPQRPLAVFTGLFFCRRVQCLGGAGDPEHLHPPRQAGG